MAKKKLNIGMVGYGFMGRTHSNAFRKVGNFFENEHQPVLKAVCGRNDRMGLPFQRQDPPGSPSAGHRAAGSSPAPRGEADDSVRARR